MLIFGALAGHESWPHRLRSARLQPAPRGEARGGAKTHRPNVCRSRGGATDHPQVGPQVTHGATRVIPARDASNGRELTRQLAVCRDNRDVCRAARPAAAVGDRSWERGSDGLTLPVVEWARHSAGRSLVAFKVRRKIAVFLAGFLVLVPVRNAGATGRPASGAGIQDRVMPFSSIVQDAAQKVPLHVISRRFRFVYCCLSSHRFSSARFGGMARAISSARHRSATGSEAQHNTRPITPAK
jgi:hypothetical protein